MANCFGEVVDNFKLNEMLRYVGKPKTREDRAREAVSLMNEDSKNIKASKYVEGVKDWYGDGVSTLCILYNATGDTLYYVGEHDWFGFIGRTPYPAEIGNGQYAAFLHTHNTGAASGSEGAVVYRGKNRDGQDRDYLVAWSTPFGPWYSNKVSPSLLRQWSLLRDWWRQLLRRSLGSCIR
ncbi:hypothetical protein VPH35_033646 [Triticum aestivum]|uniref:23 kDa jasmonate-induced protein isoform X2 n=1 Tax=Triticum aestivum TaxID=4565 RepID=UPI001D003415|nr:23 kDa jasmonate-induced protein-like isoform X2 [Triticum aestivum]